MLSSQKNIIPLQPQKKQKNRKYEKNYNDCGIGADGDNADDGSKKRD